MSPSTLARAEWPLPLSLSILVPTSVLEAQLLLFPPSLVLFQPGFITIRSKGGFLRWELFLSTIPFLDRFCPITETEML